jgi:uncharacterized repeat protein (TIGR03803 family)
MKTPRFFPRRRYFGSVLLLGLAVVSVNAQTYAVIHSFGTLSNITGFHPVAPLIQGPDGTLYGTTSEGEYNFGVGGTVFKLQPDGSGFTVLKYFTNYSEAWGPQGGLTLDGDTLYGTTDGNGGAVFKVNTDGSGFATLKQFDTYADGQFPYAGLALSGAVLYGTTSGGGISGGGTAFKLDTDGSGFTVLHRFVIINGVNPSAPLIVSGTTLYGTTTGGGNNTKGTVFKLSTSGTGFTVLRHLATADGTSPYAGLVLSGNALFGTARYGGSGGAFNQFGTVFKINTDGTGFQVLKSFVDDPIGYPTGQLLVSGATLYGTVQGGYGYGAVFKLGTDGNGFQVLKSFDAITEGTHPVAGLWLSGATLFGTTRTGGADDVGTLFKVNTDGSQFAVLKTFHFSREGLNPGGQLVASGSTLYGTTRGSAHARYGTAYKINTDGSGFAVLHSFGGFMSGDGAEPHAGLTLSDGVLFGTTALGGYSDEGTIFRLDTSGSNYTVLKSFGTASDGQEPGGGLVLSGGVLYGTTTTGGSGSGSVFKLNTNGSGFTVLKRFDGGVDGGSPQAALVLAGATLYGTTLAGGSIGFGTVFKVNADGSGFAVLKDYDGSVGYSPRAGLVMSGDVLYGLTEGGGSLGYGTVFRLNANGGDYTVLKELDGFTEGGTPQATLVLAGNMLYGTTYAGGAFDLGTVLKEFTGPEGGHPSGPLFMADSMLFGTTSEGGLLNAGVVFRISLLPSLRIQLSPSNTVVLAWPYPSDGFALEQSTNLTTTNWSSVGDLPVMVGSENQVSVNPPTGNRFYRLHKP